MNVKDIVGQRFGKLIVVSFAGCRIVGKKRKISKRYYNVVCDCGNQKQTRGENLTYGLSNSCGCAAIEKTIKRNNKLRLPNNQSHWNRYFKCHTKDAKNRGLSTNLTIDEFKEICQKDCYYCGGKPERKAHKNLFGEIHKNTIDRIDSSDSYHKDNIRPCCWFCNKLKSNYREEVVLEKIKQINVYLNL